MAHARALTIFVCIGLAALAEARAEAPAEALQETCFSPDEPCDEKLIDFVKSAKASIDVAVYDVNLDALVHALLVQGKKIPVRIVVDQRQSKGSRSLVSTLVKAGANVRFGHQRGIMHDKFTIVDGRAIETGSFNYTNHASQANQENQIYLSSEKSEKIIERYRQRFERIWSTAKPIVGVREPASS